MNSNTFNADMQPVKWPLFTTVDSVRRQLQSETKVTVAIGGWGDTVGFETAAPQDSTRHRWATRVGEMVADTGADGVDIDWEYPGYVSSDPSIPVSPLPLQFLSD